MKRIKVLYCTYNFLLKNHEYIKDIEIDELFINSSLNVTSNDFKTLIDAYKNFAVMFPKIKSYNFKDQQIIIDAFKKVLEKENFFNVMKQLGEKIIQDFFNFFVSKSYQIESVVISTFQNIKNEEEKKKIIDYFFINVPDIFNRFFLGSPYNFKKFIIDYKIVDDRLEKMIEQSHSVLTEYYINNKRSDFKNLEYKLLKAVEKSVNLVDAVIGVILYVEYKKPIQRWEDFENILINRIKDDPLAIFTTKNHINRYITLTKFGWEKFNLLVLNKTSFQGNINNQISYWSKVLNYVSPEIKKEVIKKFEQYFEAPQAGSEIYFFKFYCFEILKDRWKEKENDIIFNPILYKDVNRGIFDILFEYIKKFKIKDIILHPNIMKKFKRNGTLASLYAIAINQPVPELELTLAKGYTTAYRYATKVLKARFPLGEPKILASRKARDYRRRFNL